MLINLLFWFLIGIFAGLFVNLFFKNNRKYFVGSVAAGIIGAFVGGVIYTGLAIGQLTSKIDFFSFVISFLGALGLMVFISLIIKIEEKEIVKN